MRQQKISKNCLQCGNSFMVAPSAAHRRNSCSFACRNKSYQKKINLECDFCKSSFQVIPSSKNRKYCSPSCSSKSLIQQLTDNCKTCGKEFVTSQWKIGKYNYCSKICSNRQKIVKNCKKCNKEFKSSPSANAQFCSKDCAYKTRFGDNYKNKASKNCLVCGKTFKVHLTRENALFCEMACYRKYQLKHAVGSEHLTPKRRRLELMKSAQGRFSKKQWQTKLKYFGFQCYLCKENLTEKTACKDHRIPLSRGGANFIANIAPVCGKCNSSKRDKTEKEYREYLASR